MRVVVTGATGLTGGAVVRELVRRGHEVTGTARRPEDAPSVAELGAEPEIADCGEPGSIGRLVARADALVHVAGILFGERIAAAEIGRLVRVVVVSTAAIGTRHQRSRDAYRRNEEALRAAAPQALFVRPTLIYGSPRDRNVHRVIAFARRWRVLPLPDGGHALIQPIHYADLAAAIAVLLETGASGTVEAGGPVAITLRTAASTILVALGLRPVIVPVPVSLALPVARAADRLAGWRWAERLERAREDRVVDNTRLRELTGLDLRTFEAGVRAEIAEMEVRPR